MIYLITDTHGESFDIPNDCSILIHAGDFGHGTFSHPAHCKTILVRGNHDDLQSEVLFTMAVDGILINHIWITHEPAFTLPLGAHYNAHGHLHENEYEDYGYIKKPFHIRLLPNKFYTLHDLYSHH